LLFISAIVGFGAVVTKTPSFEALVNGLLGMAIHPYFQLILCVFAFASISGSTTAGVRLALPVLGPLFTKMGYPAGALHRIATYAGSVTDSLPHNGAVIMAVHLSGRSMKQAYPGIFVSTVLATGIGTFAVAIVCMLFPGLAG
jgi:H+/gluconate symporter-like permease